MDSHYENIFKTLIKTDLNVYFQNFEGDKKNLKELIDKFIKKQNIVFKEKTTEYTEHKKCIDRAKYENKENKCLARIWNHGRGCQCSFTGKFDGFCKRHSEKRYDWWLGTIDRPRPERPIHHSNKKVHIWLN